MQIIDTHCHYNMEPLYPNWREHWHKAQAHGVEKSIVVGTDLDTSRRAVEIAQAEPNLFAAVGVHPHDTATTVDHDHLTSLLSDEKVIALGETGLDYFRVPHDDSRPVLLEAQQTAFRTHIELAQDHHKLLIVHVRDQDTPETPTEGNAYWDALSILAEYFPAKESLPLTTPSVALPEQMYTSANHLLEKYARGRQPESLDFILHCISGPLAYIDRAITLGAYFGVAGNVTYPKADHIREIVHLVPSHQLLLETDAPFLPPQVSRGQVCEPWMISETAHALLDISTRSKL